MNVIYYHANCQDGFCSAWICTKRLNNAYLQPVQYGDAVNYDIIRNNTVYIVDFSFDPETMMKICEAAEKVICLDHHISAIRKLEDFEHPKLTTVFDVTKSGARLTGEYFKYNHWLIDHVEDRDLWRFKFTETRNIHAAIGTYPFDVFVWDSFKKDELIQIGEHICRYQSIKVASLCSKATRGQINGVPCYIVNCVDSDLISDVGGQLAEQGKCVGVTFFVLSNGQFVFSLRSRGDLDVSKMAESFGGGGHCNAAGFKGDYGTYAAIVSSSESCS